MHGNHAHEVDEAELEESWRSPPGFLPWFTHVNQRPIGRRYIFTAFLFFLLAGVLALLIRIQLARPNNEFLGPDLYNQLFTMHGTTMMFLFGVPMVEGLGIFLVPMMIGTRDLAFPRLSAFSYYVFLVGGIVLWVALFFNAAPDAGWFDYVPLALKEFSPGHRIDVYATVITFIEVAALASAVELIVTILKQRAPGMSIDRIPPFVWSILVMAVMIVFAMPSIIVGTVMLALERIVEMKFYAPGADGSPVLWQHLFWWFGHPEVYIIFLPAAGAVSSIVPVFARRPLVGYTAVVLSLIATGIISFGLWVHHMFTIGLPAYADSFFSAASMMIAIPSGVQVFAWIATLWSGRPVLKAPLLFCIGFILIFVVGGLTGVMLASVPFDKQVHDTHFVVAHFHYVLIGGVVFPLLGALHFWWPKLTGKMLSDALGKWSFWITFIGFNATFFPLHTLGFRGMPRRVFTYPSDLNWEGLNLLSSVGAFVLGLGVLLFVVNMAWTMRYGATVEDDPWGADTLEWMIESPPQFYNFVQIPVVEGRHPLWETSETEPRPVVHGLRTDRREVLVTSVLDASPESAMVLPGPSPWPFYMALGASVGFVGSMFHPLWFVVGFFLAFAGAVGWLWPRAPWRED